MSPADKSTVSAALARIDASTPYYGETAMPLERGQPFGRSRSSFRVTRGVRARRDAYCGIPPIYCKIYGRPKRSASLHSQERFIMQDMALSGRSAKLLHAHSPARGVGQWAIDEHIVGTISSCGKSRGGSASVACRSRRASHRVGRLAADRERTPDGNKSDRRFH